MVPYLKLYWASTTCENSKLSDVFRGTTAL